MESQAQYSTKSRQDIKVIQEKHRGEILTDNQVIDFVSDANVGIDSSIVWFGYAIPLEETLFYRFSKILKDNYTRLNLDEKSKLLANAGKFVFGVIRTRIDIDYGKNPEYEKLSSYPLEIRQRNLGEYLLKCLDFCEGDVYKSKEFIVKNLGDLDPKDRGGTKRSALFRFYSSPKDSEAIYDRYIKTNPKIAQLAFLLEADLFGFSRALLKYLMESVFPKTHAEVKMQILRYISQKLLNEDLNANELPDVFLFLQQNRNFYNELITKNPTDPLAQSYELAIKSLRFHNLKDKFRRKKIDVGDLVDLLEENLFLVEYVSSEELEVALNSTKDHGVALRIEKIMREKRN